MLRLRVPESLHGDTYRWQTLSNGFCGVTEKAGDCELGEKGVLQLPTLALKGRRGQNWTASAELCMRACHECSRCRYISLSLKWSDCTPRRLEPALHSDSGTRA